MKTPEEIKKGLSVYTPEEIKEILQQKWTIHSHEKLYRSAFAYIRQLEADNVKKDETIQMLQDGNASLMKMIDEECKKTVRLEQERDAAVFDMNCNWKCAICKRFTKPIDKCPHYGECGLCYRCFEWRGVPEKEENNG